jgi:hypothetical protein
VRCFYWVFLASSVADPGQLFWTPISDPGSNNNFNKRVGGEKISCLAFFVVTYFTEFKIILFLKRYGKKSEPIDKEF